jgi:hypothetical protein
MDNDWRELFKRFEALPQDQTLAAIGIYGPTATYGRWTKHPETIEHLWASASLVLADAGMKYGERRGLPPGVHRIDYWLDALLQFVRDHRLHENFRGVAVDQWVVIKLREVSMSLCARQATEAMYASTKSAPPAGPSMAQGPVSGAPDSSARYLTYEEAQAEFFYKRRTLRDLAKAKIVDSKYEKRNGKRRALFSAEDLRRHRKN